MVYKQLKVLYVEMEAEFKTYFYLTIENIKQSSLHMPSKFQPDSSKYLVTEIKFEPVCPINVIGSSKFLFKELKKHGWSFEAGNSQV